MVEPRKKTRAVSGPRRRPARWKVIATVQPQGEEGLRWVQLSYTHDDPIRDWWPRRRPPSTPRVAPA